MKGTLTTTSATLVPDYSSFNAATFQRCMPKTQNAMDYWNHELSHFSMMMTTEFDDDCNMLSYEIEVINQSKCPQNSLASISFSSSSDDDSGRVYTVFIRPDMGDRNGLPDIYQRLFKFFQDFSHEYNQKVEGMEDMAYFDEKAGHCMKTADSDKDAVDFINLFFAKFLNKNDEISEL